MDYEWDDDKFWSNLTKHGVSFEVVVFIFEGPVVTRVDNRIDYGEQRLVSIGRIEEHYFVVVHADRANVRRIISARPGGRRDRKYYDAYFDGRT